MTTRPPLVIARPGALSDALRQDGRTVGAIAKAITDEHPTPSRAHVFNVFSTPGYAIAKDKAERIAAALDRPVGALFIHRDGAPLA